MQVARYKVLRESKPHSDKLQKITQRLHFGYCQRGFGAVFAEKCENQASVAQLPKFCGTLRGLIGLSCRLTEDEIRFSHALDA